MKVRDSGMPDEKIWEQFFDVDYILSELEITVNTEKLIDLGTGYGTFSINAAKRIKGEMLAYEIEESLVKELELKFKEEKINNAHAVHRDFIAEGTGLSNGEADYVMLFNILHALEAEDILRETYRILKKNGKAGIIHWNYDPLTPRGPDLLIRPKPEQLKELLLKCGFSILKYNINLPPYHYGILAGKLS